MYVTMEMVAEFSTLRQLRDLVAFYDQHRTRQATDEMIAIIEKVRPDLRGEFADFGSGSSGKSRKSKAHSLGRDSKGRFVKKNPRKRSRR